MESNKFDNLVELCLSRYSRETGGGICDNRSDGTLSSATIEGDGGGVDSEDLGSESSSLGGFIVPDFLEDGGVVEEG
jgi:hypothetical protein